MRCTAILPGASMASGVALSPLFAASRSPEGTRTFTTLATLFGTWRARGLDPLVACRNLLLAQAAASA